LRWRAAAAQGRHHQTARGPLAGTADSRSTSACSRLKHQMNLKAQHSTQTLDTFSFMLVLAADKANDWA
jgi:hypothetical protein